MHIYLVEQLDPEDRSNKDHLILVHTISTTSHLSTWKHNSTMIYHYPCKTKFQHCHLLNIYLCKYQISFKVHTLYICLIIFVYKISFDIIHNNFYNCCINQLKFQINKKSYQDTILHVIVFKFICNFTKYIIQQMKKNYLPVICGEGTIV